MVMGLVSGLSLANHSDSESFLVVHTLFSRDGCRREGFWEVVGHVVSPFDLSRTLPVSGGSLVPCSLPAPPVIKQLMQMVTMVPGQGGRFQSVFPLTSLLAVPHPSSLTSPVAGLVDAGECNCVCLCVCVQGASSPT